MADGFLTASLESSLMVMPQRLLMTPALQNSIHKGSATTFFRIKNMHLCMQVTVTGNFSQGECSQYSDCATDWMVWGSNRW